MKKSFYVQSVKHEIHEPVLDLFTLPVLYVLTEIKALFLSNPRVCAVFSTVVN
jgi:hypothetical protein